MQLGARWRVGATPHRGVPRELYSEIQAQEAAFPAAESWTLTWLEGRPRCALDAFVVVGLDAAGGVTVTRPAVEAASPLQANGTGAATAVASADGDDDDDWLS